MYASCAARKLAQSDLLQLWSTKGKHTIFTATHASKQWSAVRKAAAASFSAACIRSISPEVAEIALTQ